jgi:uncharacterized protein
MIRLAALLFFLFAAAVGAQTLPDPLSDTVSDFAGMLGPDARLHLQQTLQAGRNETGVHVVVVTMASISDYGGAGDTIEHYAKRLFNAWGVGDARRDDGVMILIARDDRTMRIALGDGFSPVYDGIALRIIDTTMLPQFRNRKFAAGIEAGAAATINLIARPYAAHQTPAPVADYKAPESSVPDSWMLWLFGGGFVMMALIGGASRIGDFLVRFRHCPVCGKTGMTRTRTVDIMASYNSGGQGTMVTRCPHCQNTITATYAIARLTRSDNSSGGSSGFGGGSSSGGGASGRW